MTRINTNVSSLNAQKSLARSNASLQEALTRLSTGLRINVGKDDPAGLIASEVLRSDISNVERAIANTERANQVIATADSALGQVSSLLNDIRGLVVEAANAGALSDEQIAANQLQVDSSLEALNRIAQTTTFQGRALLDGSMDFITSATANFDDIEDLQIDQANVGAASSIDVEIDITSAADQAKITSAIGAPVAAAKASVDVVLTDNGGVGEEFIITAANNGSAYNDVTVTFTETAAVAADAPVVAWNGTDEIEIFVNNGADTDLADIETAFTTFVSDYWTADDQNSTKVYTQGTDDGDYATLTADGVDATEDLIAEVVFELKGDKGTEVFSFAAGTTAEQIEDAINLVSDATGVTATNDSGTLDFESVAYGSDATVEIVIISEGATGEFETGFTTSGTGTRDTGSDIDATVNGVAASGDGNTLTINTATLDFSATIAADQEDTIQFSITGGGALFQLGPDVVSNQQARIGIQSVNSASLSGASGRLYQLGSGGDSALATDPTTAAEIVDEVITKIASLRGRLGAFQKTTLDTNIGSLNDTLENLSAAESSIRDADFASESAALTRAQILVQSGTSVLAIGNSNPQNVLALLR